MKFIKSKEEIPLLLEEHKAIVIFFVDPSIELPCEALLNYISKHPIVAQIKHHFYICKLIDQSLYEQFQVESFPHAILLNNKEVLQAFIGYNR